MTNFEKLFTSFHGQLIGRAHAVPEYQTVIPVMFYVKDLMHNDVRKNGEPAFIHQIQGCLYILLLGMNDHTTAQLLKLYLLHDADEDYNIGIDKIRELIGSDEYLITAIDFMNKNKHDFSALSGNYLSAIGKGVDRTVNIRTMRCFSIAKKKEQVAETIGKILPMLKNARKNFVEYDRVMKLLQGGIEQQITIYQEMFDMIDQ
jgi:(p)ppGpp synthase/HD superfamily hydrolase